MLTIKAFTLIIWIYLAFCAENDQPEEIMKAQAKYNGNFFIFDDNETVTTLKWVYFYTLKDESKILRINQKLLLNSPHDEWLKYKDTPNHLVLKPEEFKKVF